MRPNIIKTSLSSALIYALTFFGSAYAVDINIPGFTGTANHTVSSGLSIRSADYDCDLYTGYTYTETNISVGLNTTTRGNGQGCRLTDTNLPYWTDAWGNTASKYNNYHGTQPNADDGSLNFGQGDIFDATQKIFGSITGTTSDGLGVEISYSAAYNPALDLNSPSFKKLTSKAEDEFEQDFSLYDAYVTGSFDTANGGFVDYQIGRFATSWGEATFIPVGANGLVTNALDVSKIRGPGSSIREALMPTEQLTVTTDFDGISVEGYYQLGAEQVQFDPSGSFFGSDFIGTGSGSIYAGGAYDYEIEGGSTCNLSAITSTCDATALATSRSRAGSVLNQLDNAYEDLLDNAAGITLARTQFAVTTMGSAAGDNGLGSDLVDNTVLTAGSAALGIAAGSNVAASTATGAGSEIFYTAGAAGFSASLTALAARDAYGDRQRAGVEILPDAHKHVHARDDGQYGIRLGTYLDDVGTGVDLSFYYANYHSKAPYVRIKGMQNQFAGDYYGLLRAVVTDNFLGAYAANPATAALSGALTTNGGDDLYQAIQDVAYGGTICSAVLAGPVGSATIGALNGDATLTKYTITDQQKALYMDRTFGTTITGEKTLIHNSAGCNTLAAGLDLASGLGGANDTNFALELTAAGIVAAITPLNNATYQFIYPEDNQIFGTSFSTNVGSTTLQGEVSYRPDFPLATPASSQINQISDASGATQMLNWVAYTGLNALGTNTTRGGNNDSTDVSGDTLQALLWATQTATDAAFSDDNAYENLVRDFKRSSLPAISQATVTAGDYFSTPFIEYDVWSVDIGTTTSFTASDPVTQGLGADSAAFLTEIAMVTIDGLDNSNGYVARGGFAASGDAPAKCMGAVGTSMAPAAGTSTVVGLGASIHDGLFGNGGYCEDQPGADETSFSYRLVGTATYNNFNNSRWALSPNFAFAHDPSGYGPSSLGGFVEDKMSLSLGVNATSGGTSLGLSYTNYMGTERVGSGTDKDYITASVSHSF